MRLLLLHWHAAGDLTRASVRSHLRAVQAAAEGHGVCAFNAVGGAPASLRRLRPDAVFLHTTFLAARWLAPFESWRARSSWIGELGVPVLAFPQDEYDHADVLDEWLAELGATDVFTTFPDAVGDVYPTRAGGAAFHPVLTGYLDSGSVRQAGRAARPVSEREKDVVYRATALPYWFGSHGRLKDALGVAGVAAAARLGLNADISTRSQDAIGGEAWLAFLGSGRIALGCEGGSSAIDRRGELKAAVTQILADDPRRSFDDVKALLPEGWDSHRLFALSPRHLEAAATRTAQVLIRGAYGGLLEADRHYIPVDADLGNLDDALAQVRDPVRLQQLVDRAYDEVVASGTADARQFTDLIRSVLDRHGGGREDGGRRDRAFAALAPIARGLGAVTAWRKPGAVLRRVRR